MDTRDLYAYIFEELLGKIRNIKEYANENKKTDDKSKRLLNCADLDYDIYEYVVKTSEDWAVHSIIKLIYNLLRIYNVKYDNVEYNKGIPHIEFIIEKDGIKTGYYFTSHTVRDGLRVLNKLVQESNSIDKIEYVFIIEPSLDPNCIVTFINKMKNDQLIHACFLKDFFDLYFPGEYDVFIEEINKFYLKSKNTIGYKSVLIPTKEAVEHFKKHIEDTILNWDYDVALPEDFHKENREHLKNNYITKGRYKAILSNKDFADSFITSEWSFKIYPITSELDHTGIVAGYIKSVEQLLKIIMEWYIDKPGIVAVANSYYDGKYIKKPKANTKRDKPIKFLDYTTENEKNIQHSLAALENFLKFNENVISMPKYVVNYLTDTIKEWRENQRNGYFHTDNFKEYDKENNKKIVEIREKAFLLYFLILGSANINKENYPKIGLYLDENDELEEYDDLFERFSKWATPILLFDVPREAEHIVFSTPFIGIIDIASLNESNILLNNTTIMDNSFKYEGVISLDEIVNMVKEVINENQRLKDDLSKYSSIKVTDSFSSIEIKLSEFN